MVYKSTNMSYAKYQDSIDVQISINLTAEQNSIMNATAAAPPPSSRLLVAQIIC